MGAAYQTGVSDHLVGKHVRALVALSMERFARLMARDEAWAFGIAFDGSTHRGESFFDVRLTIVDAGGELQTFISLHYPCLADTHLKTLPSSS